MKVINSKFSVGAIQLIYINEIRKVMILMIWLTSGIMENYECIQLLLSYLTCSIILILYLLCFWSSSFVLETHCTLLIIFHSRIATRECKLQALARSMIGTRIEGDCRGQSYCPSEWTISIVILRKCKGTRHCGIYTPGICDSRNCKEIFAEANIEWRVFRFRNSMQIVNFSHSIIVGVTVFIFYTLLYHYY